VYYNIFRNIILYWLLSENKCLEMKREENIPEYVTKRIRVSQKASEFIYGFKYVNSQWNVSWEPSWDCKRGVDAVFGLTRVQERYRKTSTCNCIAHLSARPRFFGAFVKRVAQTSERRELRIFERTIECTYGRERGTAENLRTDESRTLMRKVTRPD